MRWKAQRLTSTRTYAKHQHLPSVVSEYSRAVFQGWICPGVRILHIEDFHTNRRFSVVQDSLAGGLTIKKSAVGDTPKHWRELHFIIPFRQNPLPPSFAHLTDFLWM